jgi:hypothetical protein
MLYHLSQLCNSEMLRATITHVLLHRHINNSSLILQLPLSLLLHPLQISFDLKLLIDIPQLLLLPSRRLLLVPSLVGKLHSL